MKENKIKTIGKKGCSKDYKETMKCYKKLAIKMYGLSFHLATVKEKTQIYYEIERMINEILGIEE